MSCNKIIVRLEGVGVARHNFNWDEVNRANGLIFSEANGLTSGRSELLLSDEEEAMSRDGTMLLP